MFYGFVVNYVCIWIFNKDWKYMLFKKFKCLKILILKCFLLVIFIWLIKKIIEILVFIDNMILLFNNELLCSTSRDIRNN